MKYNLILILLCLLISCSDNQASEGDFEDQVIELAIKESNGKKIEFPDLYKKLVKVIPNDSQEHLLLADKLKAKGFKVVNWGRGNHLYGPRIVVLDLEKDNCNCKVLKTYYSTDSDTMYRVTETVSCKKK